MRTANQTFFGVANSITASVLFAVMYYYATLLAPLTGEEIYGWRILVSIPFLTCLILATGQWNKVSELWSRFCLRPSLLVVLMMTAFLLSIQLWLFMWAPVNGQGLAVSLGYFLLPLTLVLTGRVFFNEKPTRLQWIACAVALVGVINELVFAAAVSWPTFVVALGYPIYFAIRRWVRTNHLGGMWFDMVISMPAAAWFAFGMPVESHHAAEHSMALFGLMILGLGVLSAVSLACMITASHQLSLGLFGLLTYVEPALLVLVSLFLGERIHPSQWMTYGCIWVAILVLIVEGAKRLR